VAALGANRLIAGVDAQSGRVAIHGWQETTQLNVPVYCGWLADAGVRRVLYTDIARDGTLSGPDIDGTHAIAAAGQLRVLASGGVATVEHLLQLAAAGAEGAIIGTALYDGRLRLRDALAPFNTTTVSAC
jgi:phosphoribosylformimino-5-aminoimidazole carboxamide ribotide isomerase